MEVYDNERLEITKPPTRYALDSFHIPAETANAFKEDLKTMDKFYESLIHHPFLKPPIARAQLLSGIHNACRSYDNNDKAAAYKTTLQKHNAVGSDWTQIVELSGNMSWINQLVRFRINNIRKTWSHSFHL